MTDPAFVTKEYLIADLKELGVKGTVSKYRNSLLPSKLINEVYEDKENRSLCWLFIASYPNTPSKLLTDLAEQCDDHEVLCRLASHPRTPREVLLKLADNESGSLRSIIAGNRQITPKIAEKIANDSNIAVRAVLAENPVIFTRIQMLLTQDPEAFVRTTMTLRNDICAEAMDQLKFDNDFLVKAAIITLVNNDENYMLSLADSDRMIDQHLLLQREALPEKVLESLTLSTHPEVRTEAIRKKVLKDDELVGLAEDNEASIRKIIASQPSLPDFVQEIICNDTEQIQLVLASSFPSPPYAIKLAMGSLNVQIVLAENSNIDEKTVSFLCENSPDEVLEMLALRSDLNESHLDIIVNKRKNIDAIFALALNENYFSGISEEMTMQLASARAASLRAYAALSENVNDESVATLLKDPAPLVKEHLIRNPMLEDNELEILTNDDNAKIVRFATEELAARKEKAEQQQSEVGSSEIISGVKSFVSNLIDKVRGK